MEHRGRTMHAILGGGKVADLLLWKDLKTTGIFLGGVLTIWFLFEVWEYTFITLLCHLLILTMFAICCWSTAAAFLNCTRPRVSFFTIPEHKAWFLLVFINRLLSRFYYISSQGRVSDYVAALACLLIASVIGNQMSFVNLVCSVILASLMGPVAYDTWGTHIKPLLTPGKTCARFTTKLSI